MEILELKKYPDGILRKKCKPISQITKREKYIFKQMLFTMRKSVGIGLAAPQVGILERIIVVEFDGIIIKLANPEIISLKGVDIMKEGCLSFPDLEVAIKRPSEAVIKGLDDNGKIVKLETKGIFARALQHEIDHLNGKLIIDYSPFLEKVKFKLKAGR